MRHKKPLWDSELAVLGVFVAVVAVGFTYGLANLIWPDLFARLSGTVSEAQLADSAPSEDAYQAEVRDIMGPFLAQAANVAPDNLADTSGEAMRTLATLVQKTQDRLVRVRVPGDYRDAHLAAVLLLEQWKRALAGSKSDQKLVLERTDEAKQAYPWLVQ